MLYRVDGSAVWHVANHQTVSNEGEQLLARYTALCPYWEGVEVRTTDGDDWRGVAFRRSAWNRPTEVPAETAWPDEAAGTVCRSCRKRLQRAIDELDAVEARCG